VGWRRLRCAMRTTALLSTSDGRLIKAGRVASEGWRRRLCARPCCCCLAVYEPPPPKKKRNPPWQLGFFCFWWRGLILIHSKGARTSASGSSPSYQGPCFVDILLGGGLGVQNFPSGAPEPAPRAELEACFDRTKSKEQRGRPGCVAYRLGRERLLLQAASWLLGCSNFDRFLHTASKLGSKLCPTISNHPTP
jgi:hypothetical protein